MATKWVSLDKLRYAISKIHTLLQGKVDKVDGKGLSANDLTAALKGNYDAAYTHSQAAHAPAAAEKKYYRWCSGQRQRSHAGRFSQGERSRADRSAGRQKPGL